MYLAQHEGFCVDLWGAILRKTLALETCPVMRHYVMRPTSQRSITDADHLSSILNNEINQT